MSLYHLYRFRLLTAIQIRNFCLNKTTNERFTNKRTATIASEGSMRASSSMASSGNSSFEDY